MSEVEKPSEVSGTQAPATTSSPTSILPRRTTSSSPRIQREVHRRIFVPDDRAKRGMYEEMSSEATTPKKRSSEAPTPKKKSSSLPARSRDRDLPRRILGDETPPPGPKKRLASHMTATGTLLKRRKQLHAQIPGESQSLIVEASAEEIIVEAELQQLDSRAQQGETRGDQPAWDHETPGSPGYQPGSSAGPQSSSPGYTQREPGSCSAQQVDEHPSSVQEPGGSPGYFVRQPRVTSAQQGETLSSFDLVGGPDSPRTPPGVSSGAAAAPSSPPMAPQKRDRFMERLPPSTRGTNRRLHFD